jgi:retron-type reverse transcriptase
MPTPPLVVALAECFAAGHPSVEEMVALASRSLGRRWRWLRPLAMRYVARFDRHSRPRRREAVRFLLRDELFADLRRKYARELRVENWIAAAPPSMQPAEAAAKWDIPAITTVGDLAQWLRFDAGKLQWLADLRGLACKGDARLGHYHYRAAIKRSGAIRLIEAPKQRLKAVQRHILEQILERIPTHPAAHGFVRGRSIRTFATPHVGKRVVLRMDVQDFFPTFSAGRIRAFFRTAGYPQSVADLLGGLCTNAVPPSAWKHLPLDLPGDRLWEARKLYQRPHLPQGAPSSPALANICAWRIDRRLARLAEAAGAAYTRYADDLAFSGDDRFESSVERFSLHVAAILLEEGFRANHRKTRIMRRGVRQYLTGMVANDRVNVVRPDFDRLKATLNNCVRRGPQNENRNGHTDFRAHLLGRVGFVESINPEKGNRLRRIFEQIQW